MARMRSIKPEFFADQDLAEELPSRDARLLYIGLWGLADEHGRLRGDARSIKGQLFAYDDDLTPDIIDKLIEMIAESGRAVRYRVGKAIYLFLPKLAEHQRLEPEKTPSRLPGPDDEQAELFKISSSGNFPDESALDAEESALARARLFKHVAGSREHVAESMEQELPLAPLAESASKPMTKRAINEAFAQFWDAYPRKVSRGDAEKAYAKAIKDTEPELILAGAIAYRDHGPRVRSEIKYTKHPATWLNGRCWLDDLASDRASPGTDLAVANGHRPPATTSTTDDRVNGWLDIARLAAEGSAS